MWLPTHRANRRRKVAIIGQSRPFDERQYHSESYPGQPAPEVLETFTVTLPPGKHELAVKADTSVSYGLSEPEMSGRIHRLRPSRGCSCWPSASMTGPRIKTGRQWAVNDVRALAEKLQSNGKQIFREILTYELKDAEVTRESLLGGFQWLKRYMQTDDVGVVKIFVGWHWHGFRRRRVHGFGRHHRHVAARNRAGCAINSGQVAPLARHPEAIRT